MVFPIKRKWCPPWQKKASPALPWPLRFSPRNSKYAGPVGKLPLPNLNIGDASAAPVQMMLTLPSPKSLYTIHDEGAPLLGGVKDELRLYEPPCKHTTEPGLVAAAAPFRVFGAVGFVPELPSFPEGEA